MRNDKAMRSLMARANRDMLVLAYKGAIYDTNVKKLAKALKDTSMKYVASELYSSYVGEDRYAVKAYREATDGCQLGLLAVAFAVYLSFFRYLRKVVVSQGTKEDKAKMAFLMVKRVKPYELVRKEISKKLMGIDTMEKKYRIEDALQDGIFFLVSKHDDCAKDHEDYQGKIYVNENWRSMTKDPMVAMYISTNRIRTFQWVTGKPVYMITRPYCRHYFRKISVNEALSTDKNILLMKYYMNLDKGIRGTRQTLPHFMEDTYRERLDYLEGLFKVTPTNDIAVDIEKTKFLMRKWAHK